MPDLLGSKLSPTPLHWPSRACVTRMRRAPAWRTRISDASGSHDARNIAPRIQHVQRLSESSMFSASPNPACSAPLCLSPQAGTLTAGRFRQLYLPKPQAAPPQAAQTPLFIAASGADQAAQISLKRPHQPLNPGARPSSRWRLTRPRQCRHSTTAVS